MGILSFSKKVFMTAYFISTQVCYESITVQEWTSQLGNCILLLPILIKYKRLLLPVLVEGLEGGFFLLYATQCHLN